MATLLGALETHGGKKGVASLCIGGGEATAVAQSERAGRQLELPALVCAFAERSISTCTIFAMSLRSCMSWGGRRSGLGVDQAKSPDRLVAGVDRRASIKSNAWGPHDERIVGEARILQRIGDDQGFDLAQRMRAERNLP